MGYHDLDSKDWQVQRFAAHHTDKWQKRDGEHSHCWYCGSIDAETLKFLFDDNQVTTYSGSDWKYGYPHKFYLSLDTGCPPEYVYTQNGEPISAEDFRRIGGTCSVKKGTGSVHLKFYTMHLLDIEDPETFKQIADLIEEKFKIRFERSGEDLRYEAPCQGFQV